MPMGDGTHKPYKHEYRWDAQLTQNSQRLQEILDSIQDDFYVLDRNWNFVYASRLFTSRLGKEPGDLIGQNLWQVLPRHKGTIAEENFRAAMEQREIRRFEAPGRYTNGWFRVTVFPSDDGITVLGTDITEQKRIVELLSLENRRFEQFINSNIVGIVIGDAEGRVFLANDYYLNLLGVTRQEFEAGNVDWVKFTPPEWLPADEKAIKELRERGVCEPYEKEYLRTDGTRVPVYIADSMFSSPGQEIAAFVLDITERKRAEATLRENEKQLHWLNETLEQKVVEKTAELRRIASELTRAEQRERQRISHILHDDLQQRIFAIQVQLPFLQKKLKQDPDYAEKEISEIGNQLNEVIKIMRNLSIDLSPPILRDEGLAQAVNWLTQQMQQQYGLTLEVRASESFIFANEELHVLLFNCIRELLFNVVKHAEASRVLVTLQRTDDQLQIEIQDNGRGFQQPLPDQPHTEKAHVRSSFGLPTIRHQVGLFGGQMDINSTAGLGTRIVLTIPIPASA